MRHLKNIVTFRKGHDIATNRSIARCLGRIVARLVKEMVKHQERHRGAAESMIANVAGGSYQGGVMWEEKIRIVGKLKHGCLLAVR